MSSTPQENLTPKKWLKNRLYCMYLHKHSHYELGWSVDHIALNTWCVLVYCFHSSRVTTPSILKSASMNAATPFLIASCKNCGPSTSDGLLCDVACWGAVLLGSIVIGSSGDDLVAVPSADGEDTALCRLASDSDGGCDDDDDVDGCD